MGSSAGQKIAPSIPVRLADAIDLGLGRASSGAQETALLKGIAVFLIVLAGYTAMTALFFWQALPHLSSALLGPPEDNLQDFWNSWYARQKSSGRHSSSRV